MGTGTGPQDDEGMAGVCETEAEREHTHMPHALALPISLWLAEPR